MLTGSRSITLTNTDVYTVTEIVPVTVTEHVDYTIGVPVTSRQTVTGYTTIVVPQTDTVYASESLEPETIVIPVTYTAPAVTYTAPGGIYTPPAVTWTSPIDYTPPAVTWTPPPGTYTPPVYTPPANTSRPAVPTVSIGGGHHDQTAMGPAAALVGGLIAALVLV